MRNLRTEYSAGFPKDLKYTVSENEQTLCSLIKLDCAVGKSDSANFPKDRRGVRLICSIADTHVSMFISIGELHLRNRHQKAAQDAQINSICTNRNINLPYMISIGNSRGILITNINWTN